jgi:Ca-activated chloride channel homolog
MNKQIYMAVFAVVAAVVFAHAQQVNIPVDDVMGPMCVVTDTVAKVAVPLSPKRSVYNVIITDGLASVTLTQMFVNDYGNISDLAYIFPLPHEAAVHAMSMEYRDSIYAAEIYEKEEAKEIYDSVVQAGGVAALLLQQRPNVFQQRCANIAVGDTAFIQIKLTMPLPYDNGTYEFALPTMVAERFQSENASAVGSSGRLWNPPADRDGQGLQINVLLQTGFPIAQLQSPTHPLTISAVDAVKEQLIQRKVIDDEMTLDMPNMSGALLQEAATYPNRDFVLRFSRAAAETDFAVASYYDTDREDGFFYANIFPDTSISKGERPDLDIVLLIDISGSQNGWPLQKEKEISLAILDKLTATDRLSVLSFSDRVTWCFNNATSVPATEENIEKARTFISGLATAGGTNLLQGVEAALAIKGAEAYSRFFVFCTDGFITNESAILDEIKNHPTTPTIFTFGAGNNLNRYFLDEATKVGNGVSTEITGSEDVAGIVTGVWNKIESPQLDNIAVSFSGMDDAQLLLPGGNKLYKGSPVPVYGVYHEGGTKTVTITGNRGGEVVTLTKEIPLAEGPTGNVMLAQVWARQMIGQLRIDEGTTTANREHIIELSKEFQVLSDYTAFLAIHPVEATEDNSLEQYTLSVKNTVKDILSRVTMKIMMNNLTIETSELVYIREIAVYDLQGRCIFRLKMATAQCRKFKWDGRGLNGRTLATGQFIVKVLTTEGIISRALFWR